MYTGDIVYILAGGNGGTTFVQRCQVVAAGERQVALLQGGCVFFIERGLLFDSYDAAYLEAVRRNQLAGKLP